MTKPRVFIHRIGSWYSKYMDEANEKRLRAFAEVVSSGTREEPESPEELVEKLSGVDGILSLNGNGAAEITADVLKAAGGTVKVAAISHWFHGCHEEAVAQWQEAGVEVVDASDANSEAVVEWTVAAALMGTRRLFEFDRALKSGETWVPNRDPYTLLCESLVGLVGLGRIGRLAARYFRALGSRVIAFDPAVSAETASSLGVELVSMEDLFRTADVISLHLPVNDDTRGMIGARELSLVKDGAVFVNSARAEVMDEEAFMNEVAKKRFTAFLDVFHEEPLPLDHPLRTLDHVFITPHIAGDNGAMFRRCGRTAIDRLQQYFAPQPPRTL
jgi:phosphoglycerate dehydrogenase-like enzyme